MINKLITVALNEVGYLEKKSKSSLDAKTANAGNANYTKYARDLSKYNAGIFANGYAWCDTFVDWCFVQAFGAEIAKKLIHGWSAYTPTSAGYYKNAGEWKPKAQKGDQIFFKDAKGTICHTGIVYDVDSTYVYTVEGNTSSESGLVANGGSVAKKKYKLGYARIAGYGRPNYKKYCELIDVKDIVNALNQRGIISDASLWLNKCRKEKRAYELAYNGANKTVNRTDIMKLTTANDIVAEMRVRNLIVPKDTDLWVELCEKDTALYWLANKLVNMTK